MRLIKVISRNTEENYAFYVPLANMWLRLFRQLPILIFIHQQFSKIDLIDSY